MRRLAVLTLLALATMASADALKTIKIDPEPVPCDGQKSEFKFVNTRGSAIDVKQVHLWQRVTGTGSAHGFADVARDNGAERQIIAFGRWMYPSVEFPAVVNFNPDSIPVAAGETLVLIQGCRPHGGASGLTVQSVAMIWYTEAP